MLVISRWQHALCSKNELAEPDQHLDADPIAFLGTLEILRDPVHRLAAVCEAQAVYRARRIPMDQAVVLADRAGVEAHEFQPVAFEMLEHFWKGRTIAMLPALTPEVHIPRMLLEVQQNGGALQKRPHQHARSEQVSLADKLPLCKGQLDALRNELACRALQLG